MKYLILDSNNEFLKSDEYADQPIIVVSSTLDIKKVLSHIYGTDVKWDTLQISWDCSEISFALHNEDEEDNWKYFKLQRTICPKDI